MLDSLVMETLGMSRRKKSELHYRVVKRMGIDLHMVKVVRKEVEPEEVWLAQQVLGVPVEIDECELGPQLERQGPEQARGQVVGEELDVVALEEKALVQGGSLWL